jgi:hypothetical protein
MSNYQEVLELKEVKRCIIKWNDTEDEEEVLIAMYIDINEDEDDNIFFYCDSQSNFESLFIKGLEDFMIIEVL